MCKAMIEHYYVHKHKHTTYINSRIGSLCMQEFWVTSVLLYISPQATAIYLAKKYAGQQFGLFSEECFFRSGSGSTNWSLLWRMRVSVIGYWVGWWLVSCLLAGWLLRCSLASSSRLAQTQSHIGNVPGSAKYVSTNTQVRFIIIFLPPPFF